eukprot:TRINITY_DN26371_c0_g1_i4.p1 TRINITY_DN26371_c0_g1~~TRINITY_DN26371_c0_g1_i4.p1  ORF type:complete len:231 (-),score=48.81 TRINITY_DN26371_c0_g1_i4:33-725(-)
MLNKFPVVDHHVLVVTKAVEWQTDVPDEGDFAAIWKVVEDLDAVAFYNCGGKSGASQPHKHFQLLPLNSIRAQLQAAGGQAEGSPVPIAAALDLDAACSSAPLLTPGQLGGWRSRFRHAVARLPEDGSLTPKALCETYEALLAACGMQPLREGKDRTKDPDYPSHNLALTKRWMIVVPRANDPAPATGVGLNGIALLGFILVRDGEMFEALRAAGPSAVLADVGIPPSSF